MMTRKTDKGNKSVRSRSLLKRAGVKVCKERDRYVFKIPTKQAEEIQKSYNFSIEMLKVGGDIPLAELAVHVDEQAALEASVSMVCEIVKYELQSAEQDFDNWYHRLYYQCKRQLSKKYKSVTEAFIKGHITTKHKEEYEKRQKKLRDLQFQYRVLHNVFRSAVVVKGELLPTLRNIVQGKTNFGIEVQSSDQTNEVRNKIKV